jgi:hypothetical protein
VDVEQEKKEIDNSLASGSPSHTLDTCMFTETGLGYNLKVSKIIYRAFMLEINNIYRAF